MKRVFELILKETERQSEGTGKVESGLCLISLVLSLQGAISHNEHISFKGYLQRSTSRFKYCYTPKKELRTKDSSPCWYWPKHSAKHRINWLKKQIKNYGKA